MQLKAMALPEALWNKLYVKLRDDVLDAGNVVEFLPTPDDVSSMSSLTVFTKAPLKANSDVFLIGTIFL